MSKFSNSHGEHEMLKAFNAKHLLPENVTLLFRRFLKDDTKRRLLTTQIGKNRIYKSLQKKCKTHYCFEYW